MVLEDVDLNEILVNKGDNTTFKDDDDGIKGGIRDTNSDDFGNGYELDKWKCNDSEYWLSVKIVISNKWFIVANCPVDKLLEEKNLINICEDDVLGMEFTKI